MASTIVVRPYGARIRDRMFQHMQEAGCPIKREHVIPEGTLDMEAVHLVRKHKCRVLLVPFHAHRDKRGQRLDGLTFLEQLFHVSRGEFPYRVIMPVSRFAAGAVTMMLETGGVLEETRDAVLLLYEDELDSSDVPTRIREHVRG